MVIFTLLLILKLIYLSLELSLTKDDFRSRSSEFTHTYYNETKLITCSKDIDNLVFKLNPCDENEERKIEIKMRSDVICINYNEDSNIPYGVILPSTFVISKEKSQCNFTCDYSEIIAFNATSMDFYCEKCGVNHYNLGQGFRSCGKSKEYNQDLLKNSYKTQCLALEGKMLEENILSEFERMEKQEGFESQTCSSFYATKEDHAFYSGNIDDEEYLYYSSNKRLHYYGLLETNITYERDSDVSI